MILSLFKQDISSFVFISPNDEPGLPSSHLSPSVPNPLYLYLYPPRPTTVPSTNICNNISYSAHPRNSHTYPRPYSPYSPAGSGNSYHCTPRNLCHRTPFPRLGHCRRGTRSSCRHRWAGRRSGCCRFCNSSPSRRIRTRFLANSLWRRWGAGGEGRGEAGRVGRSSLCGWRGKGALVSRESDIATHFFGRLDAGR